jgi:hypothetical protein
MRVVTDVYMHVREQQGNIVGSLDTPTVEWLSEVRRAVLSQEDE